MGKTQKSLLLWSGCYSTLLILAQKIRHTYLCWGSFAWMLLENTLWCDQMLHSSSSPSISGNSKWVEAKTSQDGISLWYFLLLFWKKKMKNIKKLEGALVYMPLRPHVLARNQVKACTNCKKNFKMQCSKIPETESCLGIHLSLDTVTGKNKRGSPNYLLAAPGNVDTRLTTSQSLSIFTLLSHSVFYVFG